VTEKIGLTNATNTDEHRQVKVAHIPVAGDYTITTNAPESALRFTLDDKVTAFVSPRLSFGQGNPFGFLPWVFGGLCVVSVMASFDQPSQQRERKAVSATWRCPKLGACPASLAV
jgi:hypothetical protein